MSDARVLLTAVAESLRRLPFEAWHFGDSVAFEGMLAADDVLGGESGIRFAQGFARGWSAATPGFRRLDATVPGAALCEVAARTGDALLLDRLVELAEYLAARRTVADVFETWERSPLREPYGPGGLSPAERELLEDPGPGIFVDCLHFDPPFFAALADATGDGTWRRRGVEQALAYVAALQGRDGLFHHFLLERTGRAYIPAWGRGQGWALLGLLDVVDRLPAGDDRERLGQAAARLIAGMRAAQRADGHWDAVVGDPASGAESSTAAFMAVGFSRAAAAGVVPRADVDDAIARARAAVLAATDAAGRLGGVSVAVWASTSDDHYRHVPRGVVVPWGQGPLALVLADLVREDEA